MIIPIILLILTYILNIVDYQQTVYAIQLFGLQVELNPIGRFMLGNGTAWIFKLIIVPIMLAIIGLFVKIDRKQIWAVYFVFIAFFVLVVYNFCVLIRTGAF